MLACKTTISFLLFLSIFSFNRITICHGQDNYLLLSELKNSILAEISDAEKLSDTQPYILIKNIELILQGNSSVEGKAGFCIPVFSADINLGAGGDYSEGEMLAIKMTPKEPVVVGGKKRKINFSALIKDLKKAFKDEKDNSQAFYLSSVIYKKSWALKYNAEGGIDFIIASAKASISKAKEQIIIFTMCETINRVDCAGEKNDRTQ